MLEEASILSEDGRERLSRRGGSPGGGTRGTCLPACGKPYPRPAASGGRA